MSNWATKYGIYPELSGSPNDPTSLNFGGSCKERVWNMKKRGYGQYGNSEHPEWGWKYWEENCSRLVREYKEHKEELERQRQENEKIQQQKQQEALMIKQQQELQEKKIRDEQIKQQELKIKQQNDEKELELKRQKMILEENQLKSKNLGILFISAIGLIALSGSKTS